MDLQHIFPPEMRTTILASIAVWLFISGAAAQDQRQQLPPGVTPQEALRFLQRNPQLGTVVRERLLQSGLTPEQVRSQLAAAGLPTSALDAYLADSTVVRRPGEDVLQAMEALGLGDLNALTQFADSMRRAALDSLQFADSATADSGAAVRLELFGLDVFRRATTQFLPPLTGPVDPGYRLGPGDVFFLILTGDVELAYELEVTREGFVVIPSVGQVTVNGLTVGELRTVLYSRLGRAYSGIRRGPGATTQFQISVSRIRVNQVFVLGEVVVPGSYQLPSVSTVLTALYAAGGPKERANFRDIRVLRGDSVIARFDLYEYLLRGFAESDVRLENLDRIFVPVQGKRASVEGAVVRPAIYELRDGETLADLVEAAGGFRSDAALQRISLYRIVPPSQRGTSGAARVLVDVPLDQMGGRPAPPFDVAPGDSVVVHEVPTARVSLVELRGSVYSPGTYGWTPGMRLSQLIDRAGGFRPAIYAGRAHIERLNPIDSTRYLLPVSLPSDSTSVYPADLALHDLDIVTIYGREEFRSERTVTVAGMVNQPGAYEYRDGMTVRDLVLMARGLRDGAWLDSAEVARLPADRAGGTLARSIQIALDSAYLFERDSTSFRFLPGPPASAAIAEDFLLEPYDQVTIFRQPDFELLRTVTIVGEVLRPGPYALTHKNERLSDLVSRAGGLLPTAYAEGTRLIRRLGNQGRVDVDLPRALNRPAERGNIILQPGDSIEVPEYIPTIRVEGAVTNPTSVQFRQGAGLDYYIGNAGGYARNADKGRASVRYANGSARVKSKFLFFSSSPKPGPGSLVFVPTVDPADRFDTRGLITDLVAILGSITTVIVVLTR